MIGEMVGSFRVVRKIGEGGMGQVFEAVQEMIGKRAAIKVLHPEYSANAEVSTRFLNEAKAVNIVAHPGVVTVFEYGRRHDGAAYIIMELLDGESLHKRMARGVLPLPSTLRIARQIASTLSAAHDKEIVHRDLKPENVVMVPDPDVLGGERAKILDFGIAKVKAVREESGIGRTRAGMVIGTPAYMAPEQARGAPDMTDRVDVYALGVMLYQMVSGRLPFYSDEPVKVMAMHLSDTPPPLAELAPSTPQALVELIDRMMAKAAEARPAMREVVEALERMGATPSLPMMPPATVPARRARWPLALAAFLIVAAAGGAALFAMRGRNARARSTSTGTAPIAGAQDAPAVPRARDAARPTCAPGRFCPAPSPAPGTTLLAGASAAGRAWAVGYRGTIAHFDGTAWRATTVGDRILRGVAARSADEVWVVGDKGTVLRRDGGEWREVPSPTTRTLSGVWIAGPDRVYVVGDGGTILQGGSAGLKAMASGTTRALAAIGGPDEQHLFAVGQGGTVLERRGDRWVTQILDGNPKIAFQAVWGARPDDVWIVGQGGTVFHFDGFSWRRQESPTTQPLSSVLGVGRALFVSGDGGTLLRRAGDRLEPIATDVKAELTALFRDGDGDGDGNGGDGIWAIGREGIALYGRP
jgi:tRNA A-37 threonylcarbamoyl transferase component Bud32/photosystem II stability/assembly factor-like uncharacterized protein